MVGYAEVTLDIILNYQRLSVSSQRRFFPRFCCTIFVWTLEFNPVFPYIVCFPPQCIAIDSSKSDLDLALFFGSEIKGKRKCQRYIYSFESNIDGSLALVFFSLSGLNKTVSMKDKRFKTPQENKYSLQKSLANTTEKRRHFMLHGHTNLTFPLPSYLLAGLLASLLAWCICSFASLKSIASW